MVWRTPNIASYVWLGLAAALGALAKFNFFFFAVPFLVSLAAHRVIRDRIFNAKALVSIAIFAMLTTPVFVAVFQQFKASTGRMSKLYRGGYWDWLDVPGIGIDGFVSLVIAGIAWGGPLLLVWSLARSRPASPVNPPAEADPFSQALAWGMAGAGALFAMMVIVGDMHFVHERYLTPLFAGVPILAAVLYPLGAKRIQVAVGAFVIFVAVLIGIVAMVQTQKHRYAIPYPAVAAEIKKAGLAPQPIIAKKHSDVANLTLALDWPGAKSPRYPKTDNGAVLVWRGKGPPPSHKVPKGLKISGERRTISAPFLNIRTDEMVFSFQPLTPQ
jgi:hypothetical protein